MILNVLLGVFFVWITFRMLSAQSHTLADDLSKGYHKMGLIGCVLCLPLLIIGFIMAFISQVWDELQNVIWI